MANAETPSSIYLPSEGFTTPSGDSFGTTSTSRETLNLFLVTRDISPVHYVMVTPWEEAAERKKRFHTRKERQVVFAALEEIAPLGARMLLDCLESSKEDSGDVVFTLMGALVDRMLPERKALEHGAQTVVVDYG